MLVELELEQLKSTLQRKERLINSKDKQLETHLATIKAHEQCAKREKEQNELEAKLKLEIQSLQTVVEKETIRALE